MLCEIYLSPHCVLSPLSYLESWVICLKRSADFLVLLVGFNVYVQEVYTLFFNTRTSLFHPFYYIWVGLAILVLVTDCFQTM